MPVGKDDELGMMELCEELEDECALLLAEEEEDDELEDREELLLREEEELDELEDREELLLEGLQEETLEEELATEEEEEGTEEEILEELCVQLQGTTGTIEIASGCMQTTSPSAPYPSRVV